MRGYGIMFGMVIVLLFVAFSSFAVGSEVGSNVSPQENSTIVVCLDSSVCDYTSVEDAVDAAKDGDTIVIYNGAYNIEKKLSIDKEITIRGIKSSNGLPTLVPKRGIHIEADGVKLYSLEIKGSSGAAIYMTSDNNIIQGCLLTENTYGIIMDKSEGNRIVLNKIIGNEMAGLHSFKSNENSFLVNEISGNGYGVKLYYSNANSFVRCKINENGEHGIYLLSSDENKFLRCKMNKNGELGIYLLSSDENELTRCDIRDNGNFAAILFRSDYNVIHSCTVESESSCGFVQIFSVGNIFEDSGNVCSSLSE